MIYSTAARQNMSHGQRLAWAERRRKVLAHGEALRTIAALRESASERRRLNLATVPTFEDGVIDALNALERVLNGGGA